MEFDQVERLVRRLAEDPAFRADFEQAPKETARRDGIELTDADLKELEAVDWSNLAEGELEERVSKSIKRYGCGPINPTGD